LASLVAEYSDSFAIPGKINIEALWYRMMFEAEKSKFGDLGKHFSAYRASTFRANVTGHLRPLSFFQQDTKSFKICQL
jgi:hypothetical protein